MSYRRKLSIVFITFIFFIAGFFGGVNWEFKNKGVTDADTPDIICSVLFWTGAILLLGALFLKRKPKVNELESDIENIGKK